MTGPADAPPFTATAMVEAATIRAAVERDVALGRVPDTHLALAALEDLTTFLQGRRRDALRALRASVDVGADYWRWQGHAELSRQLLERLGAEVPQ